MLYNGSKMLGYFLFSTALSSDKQFLANMICDMPVRLSTHSGISPHFTALIVTSKHLLQKKGFEEVWGREYPKDKPIIVLGSETSPFQENGEELPAMLQ